jgi:hypothetical protein
MTDIDLDDLGRLLAARDEALAAPPNPYVPAWQARLEAIAAAAPALLAEVRRLRAERDELKAHLNEYADHAIDSGWHNLGGEIRRRLNEATKKYEENP